MLGESWLKRLNMPEPPRSKPNDLRANGLAPTYDNAGRTMPRLDTFGKYFERDLDGFRYGWQRVTGAYVGFALGEALGAAVDRMMLHDIHAKFGIEGVTDLIPAFDQPGRIGSLTQRLLFYTEAVDPQPAPRAAGIPRGRGSSSPTSSAVRCSAGCGPRARRWTPWTAGSCRSRTCTPAVTSTTPS